MPKLPWGDEFHDAETVRAAGPEGFDAALAGFATQLDAPLTGGASDGYEVGFYTTPNDPLFARYRMQGEPCYVRFEAGMDGTLEAWVECLTDEDQIVVLRWGGRTWSVIGRGVGTGTPDHGPATG